MRWKTVCLILGCTLAWAQQPPQQPAESAQEPAPIRVQVNEVIVPVTVTDEQGRFVSNLDKDDFRIFEDGKEQKIQYFTRERNQPVVVGFILDASNSTRLYWNTFRESVLELVWNLLPGDKRFSGFLVTSSTEAELAVKTSSDPEKIVEKIRALKPGGGSAIYDAIYLACTRTDLVQGEPIEPRRVLIILGDGSDNASKYTLDQIIEIAQRSLVTVYCLSTSAYGFHSEGAANLERLAAETGGRVEYPLEGIYKDVSGWLSTPANAEEGNYAMKVGTGSYAAQIARSIFDSIAKITGEITTQYILRYVPPATDNPAQFREIRVEVPTLPNVKVRARRGYFPFAP
ncbi:MAG: VWA domain-containing protein [bacterium]